MNSKLKYGLGGSALTASLVAVLFLALFSLPTATVIVVSEENKPNGHVTAEVWRNGICIYHYETDNKIVTIGSTWVKDFLRSGTTGATNATDDIAVGTHIGQPDNSDTKLDNELTGSGFVRASGTTASINATAYNVTYTFTATATVTTINATSLHRNPTSNSDNNAVAIAIIATISNIQIGDQVKITWVIHVPAGS